MGQIMHLFFLLLRICFIQNRIGGGRGGWDIRHMQRRRRTETLPDFWCPWATRRHPRSHVHSPQSLWCVECQQVIGTFQLKRKDWLTFAKVHLQCYHYISLKIIFTLNYESRLMAHYLQNFEYKFTYGISVLAETDIDWYTWKEICFLIV